MLCDILSPLRFWSLRFRRFEILSFEILVLGILPFEILLPNPFNENTNYMILRASQQIGMIKKICKRCDGWTHLALYRTYVLPILEYCFGCWALTKTQMERKEKERKFTKFVCYKLGFEDLSYNHRLRLLSMKSLEHRRQLLLMKYLKNLCDEESILCDFVTLKRNERRGLLLECEIDRLTTCMRHTYPNIVTIFNSLPRTIRDYLFASCFITKVDEYLEFS